MSGSSIGGAGWDRHTSLLNLKPQWVEFTSHRGVLRSLRGKDKLERAQGLIFDCPICLGDKNKAHALIFLFDLENVQKTARPGGRFETYPVTVKGYLPKFEDLTLKCKKNGYTVFDLVPGDTQCGWKGQLKSGIVYWEEDWLSALIEKFKRLKFSLWGKKFWK